LALVVLVVLVELTLFKTLRVLLVIIQYFQQLRLLVADLAANGLFRVATVVLVAGEVIGVRHLVFLVG
jgi:hypothetical protein